MATVDISPHHVTEFDIITRTPSINNYEESVPLIDELPNAESRAKSIDTYTDITDDTTTQATINKAEDVDAFVNTASVISAVDNLFTKIQSHEISHYLDTRSYYTTNHEFIITTIDDADAVEILSICLYLDDMLTSNENISSTFEEFSFNSTHPFLSRFNRLEYLITKFL